ncbi:MAG: EAL domain-containing response regulator [Pseudohongiella sp.]|nr:EAL domain-containing response regulator [Pseudohongiella sp.]
MSIENRFRILVIDDDPFFLKILRRQLKNLGYEDVDTSTHAHQALTTLQDEPLSFKVILCDLNMPGMDGIEFIRHLLSTGFDGGLVLISGQDARILDSAEALAKAHNLNFLGAVRKPVMPAVLAEVLQRTIRKSPKGFRKPATRTYSVSEFLTALDRRELINHYQPQVCVKTGDFVGVEALVRWLHPQDGMIFPDQFISLAEEFKLIDRLTDHVLLQGLGFIAGKENLSLSVNLSMDSLNNLDYPEYVMQAVSNANVLPMQLILEVTESRLMKDRLSSLDNLTRLRLKEIGLSIDDFGTGHSSLAQLRDIPFNELKIDRGFTHGVASNPALQAIFEASLSMAKQLGIKCVAEGVEDEDDWRYLRGSGCDLAQGYFIARPMSAENLPIWHANWLDKLKRLN